MYPTLNKFYLTLSYLNNNVMIKDFSLKTHSHDNDIKETFLFWLIIKNKTLIYWVRSMDFVQIQNINRWTW